MKMTPDLSQEFHPVPKVFKPKKEPKRLNPSGPKTKAWESVREKVKKEFEERGIKECEIRLKNCWKNNALSFAHIDKRNNLKYPEDLYKVVLACTPCHELVERMPAKKMRTFLLAIIANREY